jgi:hypothetical protein
MKISALAGLLLLATALNASAQSADDVIAKHVQAIGGADKLKTLSALHVKAKTKVGPGMDAPINMWMVNGKGVYLDLSIQGMTMQQACLGDSGWFVNPFGGKKQAERMNAEMIKSLKEQSDLSGPLFDYKTKGNQVELIGKEDMEGTEVFKLKVTLKSGDLVYIFLDAQNYLELKETSKQKFQDKEVETETLFSDYRDVSGLKFAFSREERMKGESSGNTTNLDEIVVNPKVDMAMFNMPK